MSDHTTDGSVVHDMFALLHQAAAPVATRWTYHTADPYAVLLEIETRRSQSVEWAIARDLLVAGLTEPTGLGDVRLRPSRNNEWDVVLIEISSPDGQAVLEVDLDMLERFVEATLELMPQGDELTAIDLDSEIAKLTQGCSG